MSRDNQDLETMLGAGKCVSLSQMRKRMNDCEKIEDLMYWNTETGEFEPATCNDCHFPKLAHSDEFCWCLNKGRQPGTSSKTGWNDVAISQMKNVIMNDESIRAVVDEKDTRPHKTVCTCGRQFKNRLQLKEHEMLKHLRSSPSQPPVSSVLHHSSPQVPPQVVVQVNDPPKVPRWDKEDFEVFESRIGDWINRTKDDTGTKYQKFVDSLKDNDKKKGLGDFVINKVLENPDHEKTVEAVLTTLREKYGKNKKERYDDIIDLIHKVKWNNDEN